MTEDQTKMKKLTFTDGLPRGTCATFTHDGQRWMAYPQEKVTAIAAVIDKLVGTLSGVRRELLWWINAHPEDAAWVVKILGRVNNIQEITKEKAEAWTMRTSATSEADEADEMSGGTSA